jgi:hypothetical protein
MSRAATLAAVPCRSELREVTRRGLPRPNGQPPTGAARRRVLEAIAQLPAGQANRFRQIYHLDLERR